MKDGVLHQAGVDQAHQERLDRSRAIVDACEECTLRWAEQRAATLDVLLAAQDHIFDSKAAMSNQEPAPELVPFSWFRAV